MWKRKPIKTCWPAVLCSWILLGSGAQGHENGAPASVCASMFPGHGHQAQESFSPYKLGAVKAPGEPGDDTVVVTIYSEEPAGFQGFFLQARDASDKNVILDGSFTVPPNCRRQSCPPFKDNTLTQENRAPKINLTTVWTPPSGFDGQVVFRATVAQTYSKFWTDLETVPVPVVTPVRSNPITVNFTSSNDYSVCGTSKGCFGYPNNCVEKKSCEILLMYSSAADGVVFEITGAVSTSAEQWIGVGLSMDARMGDDSVTECMSLPEGGVVVEQSWNVSPPRKNNQVLDNPQEGISETSGSVSDGTMYCRWKRQLVTNINSHNFDLVNQNYYLLLGKGPARNKVKERHQERLASSTSVKLTSNEVVAGKASTDYLIKIHGAFMIVAWVSFVSVGILLARHYKNVWENHTLCTLKVWFACHRTLMMASVGLIISAFVCIFVHVGGWSGENSPHPILGCICTGLAIIQPLMALFRPAPNAPKRYIFNWLHWLVGNSGQVVAVVTLFYAVGLSAVKLSFGFYYVLIAFVIFHFLFHIVMQFHTYTMEKKGQFQVHNVMQLHDMNHKGPSEVTKDAPGSGFRRWMLSIYVVVNTGLVITLVLLVVL